MKFHILKQKLQSLVTFSPQDIFRVDPDFRLGTLYDWQKTGRVIQLKQGNYIFGDVIPQNETYYLIANSLYKPSYISLELALNHYGIIPEAVPLITSVTTNKTQAFSTPFATFSYQTVQPSLFFGYTLLPVINHQAMLATLEKAILDYLYLHTSIKVTEDFESLRWNKEVLRERLDQEKLDQYLAVFAKDSLAVRIEVFRKYLQE